MTSSIHTMDGAGAVGAAPPADARADAAGAATAADTPTAVPEVVVEPAATPANADAMHEHEDDEGDEHASAAAELRRMTILKQRVLRGMLLREFAVFNRRPAMRYEVGTLLHSVYAFLYTCPLFQGRRRVSVTAETAPPPPPSDRPATAPRTGADADADAALTDQDLTSVSEEALSRLPTHETDGAGALDELFAEWPVLEDHMRRAMRRDIGKALRKQLADLIAFGQRTELERRHEDELSALYFEWLGGAGDGATPAASPRSPSPRSPSSPFAALSPPTSPQSPAAAEDDAVAAAAAGGSSRSRLAAWWHKARPASRSRRASPAASPSSRSVSSPPTAAAEPAATLAPPDPSAAALHASSAAHLAPLGVGGGVSAPEQAQRRHVRQARATLKALVLACMDDMEKHGGVVRLLQVLATAKSPAELPLPYRDAFRALRVVLEPGMHSAMEDPARREKLRSLYHRMPRRLIVALFRHTNPFLLMSGMVRLLTWRPLNDKTILQRVRRTAPGFRPAIAPA